MNRNEIIGLVSVAAAAALAGCGAPGDACVDGACVETEAQAVPLAAANEIVAGKNLRGTSQVVLDQQAGDLQEGEILEIEPGDGVVVEDDTAAQVETDQNADGLAKVPKSGGPICLPRKKIGSVRILGTRYLFPDGPGWSVEGTGPGTLTLNRTVTVSHNFSTSVSVSAKAVSAAVGYNVTWSDSTSTSFSRNIPKKQTWVVYAGMVQEMKSFHVYTSNTCTNRWKDAGIGFAYRYQRLIYGSYRK